MNSLSGDVVGGTLVNMPTRARLLRENFETDKMTYELFMFDDVQFIELELKNTCEIRKSGQVM